jgi:hypothetical protein
MWRITRKSGTLQQILIMGAMNLLHTKLSKKVVNQKWPTPTGTTASRHGIRELQAKDDAGALK